ncbi:MAG: hypothetical protein HY646_01785 [Acidobacteria bacterium]|nr:hypothetical protein [Acidobacteriota bacterium]
MDRLYERKLGTFTVVNTVSGSASQVTTVKVSCVWGPAPGGGGSGTPPPDLPGLAEGDATLNPGSHVTWTFDKTVQCVGGAINWSAEVDKADGTLDTSVTSITVSAVNLTPSSAAWTVNPGADGNPRSGTVTSSDPSTGNLKATYTGGTDTSTTTLTFVKVEYDKDPVKVGIGANRTSEKDAAHRLTATITPKSGAGSVTFDTSNAARATVAEVSRTDVGDTKQVILKVTGVTETPAAAPGGDTDVRGLLNGSSCKPTKVVVIIPKAIHAPHPQFNGNVAGQALALDETTSPAANVGAGLAMRD